ncbi:MAG: restriction endonuclease, partial [Gemmatimonadota bacterium]|nr:restriction endonuclease [Gemmatimonadota bacterium]
MRPWSRRSSAIASAETATDGMQLIEEMSDADVAEVQESAALFDGVEETTADLRGLLDFLCGWRWLTAGMKRDERAEFEEPLVRTLGYHAANAYELLARGPAENVSDFAELWHEATSIANREGFLHWEVAFPGVWHRWQESRPQGGFDAVIGNPPWDRIKLQEVEWFATRDLELALAPTAAARRKGIQQLRKQGASIAAEFDAAKAQSESLSKVFRSCGEYPLLSGGDINLYSLFVERSMRLIKPDGFVGLLTPSGIYADKTAARFFQSVSTSGRIDGLFDFENRRLGTDLSPFFPDVDSRFKFCALILGGEERRFDQTECAFFLHDTKTVHDEDRCFPLSPDDFARVNPNTGTAPVFRNRRDAEITRRIYKQHPVLVKRLQGKKKRAAWRVKYATMFHMANDSHFFRTSEQLEAEGFYPIEGNRWKRGE